MFSINVVISACAYDGEMACANAIVGCEPDVISYNSVIDACARAGNVTRAKGWFNCMENVGVQLSVRASVRSSCVRE